MSQPAPIALVFHSIIIKRRAVQRYFPGGERAFERDFSPARHNEELYLRAGMSGLDIEDQLEQLIRLGLMPGEDLALGEMHGGAILECPGITFLGEGDIGNTQWYVNSELSLTGLSERPKHGAEENWSSRQYDLHDPEVIKAVIANSRFLQACTTGLDPFFADNWYLRGQLVDTIEERIESQSFLLASYETSGADDGEVSAEVFACDGIYFTLAGEVEFRYFLSFRDAQAAAFHVIGRGHHSTWPESDQEPPPYRLARHLCAPPVQEARHEIRVDYVEAQLSALGQTDKASGSLSIFVDAATLADVRQGKPVTLSGQGMRVYGEGPFADEWKFNTLGHSPIVIGLDTMNGGQFEFFDAIRLWIDGQVQPMPTGRSDC